MQELETLLSVAEQRGASEADISRLRNALSLLIENHGVIAHTINGSVTVRSDTGASSRKPRSRPRRHSGVRESNDKVSPVAAEGSPMKTNTEANAPGIWVRAKSILESTGSIAAAVGKIAELASKLS